MRNESPSIKGNSRGWRMERNWRSASDLACTITSSSAEISASAAIAAESAAGSAAAVSGVSSERRSARVRRPKRGPLRRPPLRPAGPGSLANRPISTTCGGRGPRLRHLHNGSADLSRSTAGRSVAAARRRSLPAAVGAASLGAEYRPAVCAPAVAVKRLSAGQHLVQDHAQGPDVGPPIKSVRVAADLLRAPCMPACRCVHRRDSTALLRRTPGRNQSRKGSLLRRIRCLPV